MTDIVDQALERYAIAHTSPPTGPVAALRAETEATMPVPQMAGGIVETRLLEALVVASAAGRVLEIGTFTGVGALSMASRLPPGGTLITLERDEAVAATARRHIEASPHADRIRLHVGDALEALETLEGPFDLVFIDAWKRDYSAYYEAVLPKLSDRGVIVADNILRQGLVLDPEPDDPDTAGIKAFADRVQQDPRVDNALLTVGDGLLLIWKRAA